MKNLKARRFYLLCLVVFMLLALCRGSEPVLVPTLDTPLDDKRSTLYCPTLQMVWDRLGRVVGGPIAMSQQDELVTRLNAAECPSNVVPVDAHVTVVGFAGQRFRQKLEQALHARFGFDAPELPPIFADGRDVIVSYSHLNRCLLFPRKFVRSNKAALPFMCAGKKYGVAFFGVPKSSADRFESQVAVLHYAHEAEFAICLKTRVEHEFVVLASMQRPDTLLSAVETVQSYLRAAREASGKVAPDGKRHVRMLAEGDLLAIPVVELGVAANFPQLCRRRFKNKGFEKVWLRQVYQDVAFKMDETGIEARSTAYAEMFGGSAQPRRLVFDKPFLLTLWNRDAERPYLVLWVASPDVLVQLKATE